MKEKDLVAAVKAATHDGLGPDASGATSYEPAISFIRPAGVLVPVGLPPDASISLDVFWSVFETKRVVPSYVGNRQDAIESLQEDVAKQESRWDQAVVVAVDVVQEIAVEAPWSYVSKATTHEVLGMKDQRLHGACLVKLNNNTSYGEHLSSKLPAVFATHTNTLVGAQVIQHMAEVADCFTYADVEANEHVAVLVVLLNNLTSRFPAMDWLSLC
ncbi:alcohol dehydrogenase [Cladochytrium tenue]|nr:alcohol dehydrogenase [Cladochytrium tenue]